MDVLAEARQVTMRFGAFTAVDAADLAITGGEVVGLLGANGAGKTTLIRLLLGLLEPSDGIVRLFGSAPSAATRRRVGYVPQTLGLYVDLTVAENWSFTTAAFGYAGTVLPRPSPPGGASWSGRCRSERSARWRSPWPCPTARSSWCSTSRRRAWARSARRACGSRSGRPPTAGPACS